MRPNQLKSVRLAVALLLVATFAAAHEGHANNAVVDSVVAGGPAEAAGLQEGDRIILFDGRELATTEDLKQIVGAHQPGDTVRVTIDRAGEEIEFPLTFGARPDGGVLIGVSVGLMSPGDSAATATEEGLGRDECLAWIDDTYQVDAMNRDLGLDLADDYRTIRACVEKDVQRMAVPIPPAWCDNVFKIHCSGLNLVAEIGEVQVEACAQVLSESLGLNVSQDSAWTGCAEQKVFDRYSMRGEATDEAACKAIFFEECGGQGKPQAWLQWGGSGRDFQVHAADLASSWPADGPEKLWRRTLGEGYSAILFEDGRLYTMYRIGDEEAVVCLDAETGETVWESRYEASYGGVASYGTGPRSTPLLVGETLFTVGVSGRMHALDKSDGRILWNQDLWGDEFRGNSLEHGYSSSPVAYEDTVIVPVGGENAGLVAFDRETGRVRWQALDFKNSYSSPRLATIAGEEQLIVFMAEELIGVDPDDGTLRWRFPHANQWGHNISTPVIDGDRIFLSSPQVGARGLRLIPEGDTIRVEQVWSTRRVQFYHATAVRDGDWVYGTIGTMAPAFMTAVNLRTGEIAWRERGFARANCVRADGKLVVLDENGTLFLATATPEKLEVLAESQLLDRPAWTVPTIVGQTMYVRDQKQILAVDLG